MKPRNLLLQESDFDPFDGLQKAIDCEKTYPICEEIIREIDEDESRSE